MAEPTAEEIAACRLRPGLCSCGQHKEREAAYERYRASMSVVDEDRLTRRNPDHLDWWRFR